MRGFLIFIAVVAAVFFGVGQTRGWLVGVVGNTPIFAYNTSASISGMRNALNSEEINFSVEGKVQKGTVVVEATYERPQSFQNQTQKALPERTLFTQEFRKGETITVNEVVKGGQGFYRVRLSFNKGSGRFKVTLPDAGTL